MFYSFLRQSVRLSNSLRFLFLDNLCYSCTCLAPPRLAFQLFAGQTIQLLYFCTKNKVVVVVVVVTTEQVEGIAKPAVQNTQIMLH